MMKDDNIEDNIEMDFVECIDNKLAGRQQENRTSLSSSCLDEGWGTINDIDVFAQWIEAGTNKEKGMMYKKILEFCCVTPSYS